MTASTVGPGARHLNHRSRQAGRVTHRISASRTRTRMIAILIGEVSPHLTLEHIQRDLAPDPSTQKVLVHSWDLINKAGPGTPVAAASM